MLGASAPLERRSLQALRRVARFDADADVEAVLTRFAARKKEKLDWRRSIVDLMKVLDLDSSLSARKHLTQELHYTGDTTIRQP
jgi:Domain of unknown function (DUF3597)